MPRSCVFCQFEGVLTGEHVIGEWVGGIFPFPIVGHTEIIRNGRVHKFKSEPLEQEVRSVCASCNSGWMSALEDGVKPFLGPMLKDWKRTRLTPSKQRLLATWAVKTALMFDQVHRSDQTVPPTEYHRFYALKQPPNTYVVWIGWRNNIINQSDGRTIDIVQSRQEVVTNINYANKASEYDLQKKLRDGGAIYRITFGIGHVVFQVFGTTITGGLTLNNIKNIDIANIIWPVSHSVAWPPRYPIDEIGGLDNFHNAFSPGKQTQ